MLRHRRHSILPEILSAYKNDTENPENYVEIRAYQKLNQTYIGSNTGKSFKTFESKELDKTIGDIVSNGNKYSRNYSTMIYINDVST